MSAVPMRSWLPFMLAAAVAWGSSFLFIKVGLEGFSPAQVGFGRLVVGSVVLLGIVLVTRSWPRVTAKQVGAISLAAIALSGAPMILIPMAQQHIGSILASLLNATTPLWTALFLVVLLPSEKSTRAQLFGVFVGALGIAVLLGAWDVKEFPVLGAALMLAGTAFYGVGAVLSRILLKSIDATPAALSMIQVSASALMLAPFAFASGAPKPGAIDPSSPSLWAVVALGVFGTSFAYVLFWKVVKIAGPAAASSVTYVSPVVAVILGVLVAHEGVTWYEPVGAVVVLLGVYLTGRSPKVRSVEQEPSAIQPDAEAPSEAYSPK